MILLIRAFPSAQTDIFQPLSLTPNRKVSPNARFRPHTMQGADGRPLACDSTPDNGASWNSLLRFSGLQMEHPLDGYLARRGFTSVVLGASRSRAPAPS